MLHIFKAKESVPLTRAAALCFCTALAMAQEVSPSSNAVASRQSRAQQEAAQQVSLSADKIIEILEKEPGLLLQVKKLLVQEAFEQGQLVDSKDLSDQAVFRSLREDEKGRILATREIEARGYISLKPTHAEVEQRKQREARPREDINNDLRRLEAKSNGQTTSRNGGERDWEKNRRSRFTRYAHTDLQVWSAPAGADSEPENAAHGAGRTGQKQYQDSWEGIASGVGGQEIRRDEAPAVSDSRFRHPSSKPGSEQQLSAKNRHGFPAELNPDISEDDRPAILRRPNPYSNVPSLYDLYAQVSARPAVLERFGMEIFRNPVSNLRHLPMDLPVGPDYVLGPGDNLDVAVWGGVARRLKRVVDREGRLELPEAGTIEVSGHTLGETQRLVQAALRTQFRDVQTDISLGRLRTVRVYVVGDVVSPGAYDISSLSTVLNALYAAGGPSSRGSLRHVRHLRGDRVVNEFDAYDLLLHGIRNDPSRIQSGDTILVPPTGPEITVEGMVRRPAIYELAAETTLAEVLELAGGVLPSAVLRHMDVERLVAHEKRTMIRLDLPQNNDQEAVRSTLEKFHVQDGDRVKISPILPYAEQAVYLDGHVFHPGKYPFREGMKVSDLVRSYSDLLPEPSSRHAEIIRLQAPDSMPAVLAFNLGDAMSGKGNDQDLLLKPFDTVRIFGRYHFEDPPIVSVSGEVRHPGDHITNGVTHLRDAVYLAGGTKPEAELQDAQVFRRTSDNKLRVISVNLAKALAGDSSNDILLEAKDRIFIQRSSLKADPAAVVIQGQVEKPGKYALGEEMSATDLVRLAGGLKRGAYTEVADLSRYQVENGQQIVGEHTTVRIAAALSGEPDTDLRLRDGDVLTIGELAGWKDVGATITVKGEVAHPGTYGIREGERLSSILQRAGGFRADAYPYGAIFERLQVRELEERNHSELVRRVESQGEELKSAPANDEDQKMAKQAAISQWQAAMQKLQNTPPSGRLVIHLWPDVKRWANTLADLEMRAGDVLYIPKKPNIVMVDGSVYNPTAITYKPGKNVGWYLRQAGGPTVMANRRATFVIRADGSVASGSGGLFTGGVEGEALSPGDMVIVPDKAFSANTRWKSTLLAAQLVYAVGVALQVGRSF